VPNFLAQARNKTVIHIGAHSIAYTRTPSSSVLLLADSPGRIGAITAGELLSDLKLDQTRLVVLAACSSAGGLPVGPEGVAPLVRPLITAGVPAVAGTLWSVDDATAEKLSVSFHAYYRKGRDAATALQRAQLDLLRNKNLGLLAPSLSWASFQVIGHASSPFGERAQRLTGGTPLGLHRTNSLHRDDGIHPQ
jgi:CHAT domain-containing protein